MRNSMKASIALSALAAASCTSIQNQSALEALQEAKPTQPIVEGFFEFGGPDPKWAGPVAFVVHVKAGETGLAVIESNPDLDAVPEPAEPAEAPRGPAAEAAGSAAAENAHHEAPKAGHEAAHHEAPKAGHEAALETAHHEVPKAVHEAAHATHETAKAAHEEAKAHHPKAPEAKVAHDANTAPVAAKPMAESSRPRFTASQMRAKLGEIAALVSEDERVADGCLYPVRVRLVRLDGSLLEKQGCRSAQGWTGAVSRAVGAFLGG